MAFTIVRVASGGLPVVESDRGLPYYEAENGFGIPVTFGSTGIALGGAGVSKPAYPTRGLVANRMSLPLNQFGVTPTGSPKVVHEQSSFRICQTCTNVSVVWQNLSAQTSDEKGEAAYTVKAAIFRETASYAGKLGTQPLTWSAGTESGRRSPSITPGAISETDKSAFTATAGDRAMVRRQITTVAAMTKYATSEYALFEGDDTNCNDLNAGGNYDNAGYVDSGDPAGAVYSRDIADLHVHFGPAAIIGDTTTKVARIAVLNDSQGAGSGDSNSSETTFGWVSTALGTTYPSIRIGQSGYSLAMFMADSAKRAQRIALFASLGITHVLLELGTNDVEGGTGGSTFMTNLAAFQAELAANANPAIKAIRVIPCTLTPRTNAGNSAPTANNATRLSTNASIIAANGCGYGYLDIAALTFASGGTSLWDTTGGRGSGDGVHQNAATHAYVAAQVQPQLSTLLNLDAFA